MGKQLASRAVHWSNRGRDPRVAEHDGRGAQGAGGRALAARQVVVVHAIDRQRGPARAAHEVRVPLVRAVGSRVAVEGERGSETLAGGGARRSVEGIAGVLGAADRALDRAVLLPAADRGGGPAVGAGRRRVRGAIRDGGVLRRTVRGRRSGFGPVRGIQRRRSAIVTRRRGIRRSSVGRLREELVPIRIADQERALDERQGGREHRGERDA